MSQCPAILNVIFVDVDLQNWWMFFLEKNNMAFFVVVGRLSKIVRVNRILNL